MAGFQKMDNRPLDIIPTFAAKNKWTVLIQVLERHSEKEGLPTSAIPGVPYKNFVATDTKGTKVGIVAFGKNVRQFSSYLIPYKRYRISNATLKHVQRYYQIGDYAFSWRLTNTTLVDPVEERVPPPLPCQFNLTKFSALGSYLNHNDSINIRALVIHHLPTADVSNTGSTKDLVVIDEENTPMTLRIWDDLLDDGEVRQIQWSNSDYCIECESD